MLSNLQNIHHTTFPTIVKQIVSSDELFLQSIVEWWMPHQDREPHEKQHILFSRWFSDARGHKTASDRYRE
jgi:hypothetical protein